jgi:C-terminal processing protease CtpA/Prc
MLNEKDTLMKKLAIFILTAFIISCKGPSDQGPSGQKFNFGFEKQSKGIPLSDGWFKKGNYVLSFDTLHYSGEKSCKITSTDYGNFGGVAYRLPAKYSGKTIKLEGYIKIKNVEDGFAGLLLMVNGYNQSLAKDMMEDQDISGTRDWQKYSIKLDYPEEAQNIFIGGVLTGKGEAWFNDFVLSIDGQNVQTIEESDEPTNKASLDNEFDNGSKVDIPKVTPEVIENLALLGKIWGFLKYYHPEIAEGNYNWDYELFRMLPDYLNASGKPEREKLLLQWINDLGKVDECETCQPAPPDAILRPDLEWIIKNINNKSLIYKLYHIYENRNQWKHYYIKMGSAGNPIFKNEDAYYTMPYPDIGFRILALFRYWNMIHYFYPYKYLIDRDWDNVLKAYIPIFIHAENELEYELATLRLIGEINDNHANLWGGVDKINKFKGNYYAPVNLRFIEGKLVVTDYYNPEYKKETELKVGDIITKIEGKPVNDIVTRLSKYYPASNKAARLRDLSEDLLRSQKNELEVEYLQEGKLKTKNIKLYPKSELDYYRWHRKEDKKCYRLLDNNIGYITLGSIKNSDIPEIKEEFKNTRGIIIDIRNYPSTFVPFELGSFFVSSPTPFVKFTTGYINNPGEFTFAEELEIPQSNETYQGKLIVLVNEYTQSQAEYTAMALRAGDNTTIIGSTTAGADGNVSTIRLPGGLFTSISGIGVYYPNGEETQRVGIVPDIEVKPTIKGIKKGKDELIEKAKGLILSE